MSAADELNAVSFIKMHSLGNDVIIVDARSPSSSAHGLQPTSKGVTWACDRHFGIGADQLVLLEPPATDSCADGCCCRVRFFNVDGYEAGACGNATRCVASLLMDASGGHRVAMQTGGGMVHAARGFGASNVAITLPPPRCAWDAVPMSAACDALHVDGLAPPGWPPCVPLSVLSAHAAILHVCSLLAAHIFSLYRAHGVWCRCVCLSMGNPQCVLFAPDGVDLAAVDM